MNIRTKILLYGVNIWYFGEGMFGPLFAVFSDQIGGDILDITWAWAIYLIIAGTLYIVVGRITDIYNNGEKIMVFGFVLNALFTFGYLLVSEPIHLFMVQMGLGVAAALATPTWDSLYAKNQSHGDSGFQWGLATGSAEIITGIAILVGGYIVSMGSFQLLFIVMGCVQLVGAIYQAKIIWAKPIYEA